MKTTREEADRKRKLILTLHNEGLSSVEIAQRTGIHIALVCKRLKEAGFGKRDEFMTTIPKPICEECEYPDCVWNGFSAKCPMEKGKPPKRIKKRGKL